MRQRPDRPELVNQAAAVEADDRFVDWGGNGPLLHFAHGNGFPPGTYRRLIAELGSRYHVVSLAARPLWSPEPPSSLESWQLLADDLARGLRERGLNPVVGVGHSLGAVISLLAAAREPGLFSALVLLDPVMLSGFMSVVWKGIQVCRLSALLPLARRTRRRQERWPVRATAARAYAMMPLFRGWAPEVLEDYLDVALVPTPEGDLALRYPRESEARIFELAPASVWHELASVDVPVLFVQGERTHPRFLGARRKAARILGQELVVVVPGTTHCVPMEKPREVGQIVLSFLSEPR